MPYVVHAIGQSADASERSYDTKTEALEVRGDGETVTFRCSNEEREEWQAREVRRFRGGTYCAVPWQDEFDRDDDGRYPHISLEQAGMVAYTPDDDHGVRDKQIRVRPGRYLEQFHANIAKATRDDWTAAVRGFTSTLKLATTAEEIVKVYVNGPHSCMAHRAHSDVFSQCDGHHPTEVYGDSDLAVAYLGELGAVRARCVVWPERKVFTRIYGDEALRCVLRAAEYSEGSLSGAHIRAVQLENGRYLMPYIDAADGAEAVTDGGRRMLKLGGGGDLNVKVQGGHSPEMEEEEETYLCGNANCGNDRDEDADYCDACARSHYYCNRCEIDYFDDDKVTIGGDHYCEDCARELRRRCEMCGAGWYEENLPQRVQREREADGCAAELCEACGDTYTRCEVCDTWRTASPCEDCTPEPTPDTDTDTDNASADVEVS